MSALTAGGVDDALIALLARDSRARAVAARLLALERAREEREHARGYDVFDCDCGRCWPGLDHVTLGQAGSLLTNYATEGLLCRGGSNRRHTYRLASPEWQARRRRARLDEVAAALAAAERGGSPQDGTVGENGLPDDLFARVIGYERVKRRLRGALEASHAVGVLLIGGPGTGKSLLFEDLMRLPRSHLLVGDTFSAAGIDRLMRGPNPPRRLIVDEIDKITSENGKGGLNAMHALIEAGIVARTKGDTQTNLVRPVQVFAAGNKVSGQMVTSLLSRFWKIRLPEYTIAERLRVIAGFLVGLGCDPEHAAAIAYLVAPVTADVRQARHIFSMYDGDLDEARQMVAELREWEAGSAAAPRRRRSA